VYHSFSIALAEPLSVAWHATTRTKVSPHDPVLVIGAGPVGLGVLQVLKAQGVKTIIVSERSELRRTFAQKFGATHVVDPTSGTALDEVRGLSGGEGAAVVFDAAGVQPGLDFAIAASRVGATIVNIAIWKNPATINTVLLILGEKTYIGTMTYLRKDFEGVIEAMGSGKMKLQLVLMGRCGWLIQVHRSSQS
jgi:threonine dehydrogenase-like Zn-dependent dehydrogenase